MNTSGVLQTEGLHVNFARDPKYSWFQEQIKYWIYFLYLKFIVNIYNKTIIFNLWIKTVLYLKYLPVLVA